MDTVSLPAEYDAASIPALLLRAGERLMAAKSSGEVLEAKHLAEAALHYAKVTEAANETHADCLRIIARAEIRMANEIDRGREQGRVAGQGRPAKENRQDVAVYDELGVDHRRVADWRATRDAGEEVVEEAINGALSEGRAPTKADIKRHVHVSANSGNNEWYTPPEILDAARAVLGDFDLDPASSEMANRHVRAAHFFTAEDDGLRRDWPIGAIWMNPPYAQPLIAQFSERFVKEIRRGSTGIVLVNNATDTGWFQGLAAAATAICFLRGRLRFLNEKGEPAGAPLQGQALIYFGPHVTDFAQRFAGVGFITTIWHGEV